MMLPTEYEGEFSRRGFMRLKSGGKGFAWRKTFDSCIYWDIHFAAVAAQSQYFGCSLFVRYHPSARDVWGDDGPFDIVIREHDVVGTGLVEAGTPGSAVWRIDRPAEFFVVLDSSTAMLSRCCYDRTAILEEAKRQYAAAPRNISLLMAVAFLQLEKGEAGAARESFSKYLAKVPALTGILGPHIDALFLQDS